MGDQNLNKWVYDKESKRWMFYTFLEKCEIYWRNGNEVNKSGWIIECESLGQVDSYENLDEAKGFVENYIYEGYCSLTKWAENYQRIQEALHE
jgi:hypothetical protein